MGACRGSPGGPPRRGATIRATSRGLSTRSAISHLCSSSLRAQVIPCPHLYRTLRVLPQTSRYISGLKASQAFVFFRDFVRGSDTTGLVDSNTGSVVGGEDTPLAGDVMLGEAAILYGAGDPGLPSLSTVAPSATLASWAYFIATATATVSLPNGGRNLVSSWCSVCVLEQWLEFC